MRLVSYVFLLLFMYGEAMAAGREKKRRNVVGYLVNVAQNTILSAFEDLKESEVKFYLVTREGPRKGVELLANFEKVNSTRPVKFMVHGHFEDRHTSWYSKMSKALLKRGDFTIIQVNWPFLARQLYPIAVGGTEIVGNKVGELIVRLHVEKGIPLKNVHVIGHSLGGHVAGFAGKKVLSLTGSKIRQITGLDVAGPFFERPERPKERRLSEDDAEIVENIHTDGGVLGYKAPLGTIDIYPNGGTRIQRGCGIRGLFRSPFNISALHPVCSHRRSHQYYIQALSSGGIPAVRCDSYKNFVAGKCQANHVLMLGNEYKDDKTRGIYFF